MVPTVPLSEARRTLLERYRQGDLSRTAAGANMLPRRAPGRPVPLSCGQQQLWLLAQLAPDTLAYNECVTIHLPGPLDVTALERAFSALIERHEAWRTSFPVVDSQPIQEIHPAEPIRLPVTDLRELPEDARETEAVHLATLEAARPFDLARGPLLRASLVRLGDMEHRLYLALHHIIFDGVAMYQVFLPELRALYEACLTGQPVSLPALPIQYGDFACWQRDYLRQQVSPEHLAYWKQRLAGAPALLALPTDHPRPSAQTYHGATQSFRLSRELSEALKIVARQEGVTLYMTLVAAFNTLLYRYTGQEDLLVGSASAGRNRSELRHMLGYFLTTLVLRTDLSGDPPFAELLRRVRAVVVEACAYEDVPFELVVQELQPHRDLGHNPLFQVMISLVPPLPVLPCGWTLTQMDVEIPRAKFDLSLELDDRTEGIIGRFEYSTDLFDAATMARMAGHWQTLLAGIAADPSQHLSALPLLTSAERQQMLVTWNATRTPYPHDSSVARIFEAQVERAPEAVALICGERQLSYGALNARANQLAHHLCTLGVAPGDCVGVCMERSPEMVVGLLGILKAGGVYVPLDPAYPRGRLAFMLQDTRSRVLLTQEHLREALPTEGRQLICLDAAFRTFAGQPEANPASAATAESVAYIMYTSGSTGRPKGVEIRHRSIMRLVFGVDCARLDADQILLHMAPISFDASTFEVWGALLHGARCVLLPGRIPTTHEIAAAIQQHHVTTAWLTASLFNTIVDESPQALVGLKQLLTGGEALSVAHVRRALESLPTTQLINGYGPTETTTFACCYRIPRPLSAAVRSIPIGRPIGNTHVYILDRQRHPVPIGTPGELYIGGAGVARGYLNRPELTAEKFVVDPFAPDDPQSRLYRTGDLVRFLPDGTIEFLGRLDHQVKIRGFRIEPGEIEVALAQYPAVREALVLAREDKPDAMRLVAYVVPQEGAKVSVADLRRFLTSHLPEYMIPAAFVVLEALPITPNGKVDRQALPAPETIRLLPEAPPVAPATRLQQQVVQLWEDLLAVRPIGISDSFFDLGGHSLLAARLVSRIEQSFGRTVSLATFFADPTVAALAEALADGSAVPTRSGVVAIQTTGSKPPFFFLHGDFEGGGHYCWNLARALGPDQPFYALDPCGLGGRAIPSTMAAMAATHVEQLREVQPTGPYFLGGYCNGAVVAYEMAQQLCAAGASVALLVLVDASALSVWRQWGYTALGALTQWAGCGPEAQLRWFMHLRRVYRTVRYAMLPDIMARAASWAVLARAGQRARAPAQRGDSNLLGASAGRADATVPQSGCLGDMWATYGWLISRYPLRPYAGKVTHFFAEGELAGKSAIPARKWRRAAPAVAVHQIPGTHETSITTYVQVFAAELSACLSQAQAPNSAAGEA